MREFMTKLSDYLNERRNDPARQEDNLAIVIVGAVAVVVIVILLLLLWSHLGKERGQASEQTMPETEDTALTATTYEEDAPQYMSQNDGLEALRQEYLERLNTLDEKVAELLTAVTQTEENMTTIVEQYRTEDAALKEQITTLHTEISTIVQNLKETQTKLYELIDIVQIMDQETIPLIRQQIIEIHGEMEQVHTDISKLYTRIASLEQEDEKLWKSIHSLQNSLKIILDQNLTEVNNQFDSLLEQLDQLTDQLKRVEKQIGKMAIQTLRYRYDAEENTLYLEPYEE